LGQHPARGLSKQCLSKRAWGCPDGSGLELLLSPAPMVVRSAERRFKNG
jgi:hypothetical protein